MKTINGYCRTNLDGYERCEWPKHFVAVPRVGERVQATNIERSLKVVAVTHLDNGAGPLIEVELNR